MCRNLYCVTVQRIIDKAKGLGVRAPGMRGLLRFCQGRSLEGTSVLGA